MKSAAAVKAREPSAEELARKAELDAANQKIQQANATLAEARIAVAADFTHGFRYDYIDATRLAKALSDKFHSMKITVSFERGDPIVYMTPLPKEFELVDERGYYAEQKGEEAAKAAASPGSVWPTRAEVKTYLAAFKDGFEAAKREISEQQRAQYVARMREMHGQPFQNGNMPTRGWPPCPSSRSGASLASAFVAARRFSTVRTPSLSEPSQDSSRPSSMG